MKFYYDENTESRVYICPNCGILQIDTSDI